MEAKLIESAAPTLPVAKQDIVAAWRLLELLVVSLRKMGSYYSTPTENDELPPEQLAEMRKELDEFLTPELWRELGAARVRLASYLPGDETEAMSDALPFWVNPEQRLAK